MTNIILDSEHVPVMLNEILDIFQPCSNKFFIDCTFGRGGHTYRLLESNANVLALDRDNSAAMQAKLFAQKFNINQNNCQFEFINQTFDKIDECFLQSSFHSNIINGILWDFGLCTAQLKSNRGFSFKQNDLLDMRMGGTNITAADILNKYCEAELADIFYYFGDETRGKFFAKQIVAQRKLKPFLYMQDLLSLFPQNNHYKIHPATKILQALRIAVNDELTQIQNSLLKATKLATTNTIFACISFHSGEDRIVKNIFKNLEKNNQLSFVTSKPILPTEQEIKTNPPSRSAKLRYCVFK